LPHSDVSQERRAKNYLQDETKADPASAGQATSVAVFDIVNGFLNRCRGGIVVPITIGMAMSSQNKINQVDYLAEIIPPHLSQRSLYARLSLMVWILKREVRAFGGCLGMYRRRRTWHAAISVGEL
jgi:hypothetical protein